MAVSRQRIFEIIEYFFNHDEDDTCKQFSLDKETLSRYRRLYKQYFGENADLLFKIRSMYSPEELRVIANGTRPVIQSSTETIDFEGDVVTLGVMSDTHIGSIYTDDNLFPIIINEMKKQGCQGILHPGDIVEGMMARPDSIYELSELGFIKQRDKAIKMFELWDGPWWIIDGNHDDSFNTKLGAGISMGAEIARILPNVSYRGNGVGEVTINGINIALYHGKDGGSSYALSYRLQKIIESMASKRKPQILIAGHDHKTFYLPMYRNVQGIAAGCIQRQTNHMALQRSMACTGFWIIKFGAKNGSLLWFNPTWYPLYI